MLRKIQNFIKGKKGQGMVEYALILALIAVVVIAAGNLAKVGTRSDAKLSSVATALV